MTIRYLAPWAAAYQTEDVERDQTMMAQFFREGALAIRHSDGVPVRVVDLGAGAVPRYVFREVMPVGSPEQDRLRWNDPTDRWISDAGIQVQQQVYPWFVLTRTDAVAEAVTALMFFLADRNADQSLQPFAVAARSGIGSGLSFTRATDRNNFNQVWPVGGPNPFWWAFIPAETDEPDQWWIRYWTHNQPPNPRVWVGWTDDGTVAPADLVDAGSPDAVTVPARATAARLAVWLPGTYRMNNLYGQRAGGTFFNPSWYYNLGGATDYQRGGVDGHLRITRDAVQPADATEAVWTVSLGGGAPQQPLINHEQPHPDVLRNVLRINGQTMDASRAQVAGDRPQDSASSILGVSTFAWMGLQYSAASTEGSSVEPITQNRLSRSRGAMPTAAMFVGWAESSPGSPGGVDVDQWAPSQTLNVIFPRTELKRAYPVIWLSETALGGHDCFGITWANHDVETCNTAELRGPDGRIGRVLTGLAALDPRGLEGQLLTVAPYTPPEE